MKLILFTLMLALGAVAQAQNCEISNPHDPTMAKSQVLAAVLQPTFPNVKFITGTFESDGQQACVGVVGGAVLCVSGSFKVRVEDVTNEIGNVTGCKVTFKNYYPGQNLQISSVKNAQYGTELLKSPINVGQYDDLAVAFFPYIDPNGPSSTKNP